MKKIKSYIEHCMSGLICRYFLLHMQNLRKEAEIPKHTLLFYRLMLDKKALIIEGLFNYDHGSGSIRLGYAKLHELIDNHASLISPQLAVAILSALENHWYTSISMIGNREEIMKKCLLFIDDKTMLDNAADSVLYEAFEAQRYEPGESPDGDLINVALQAYKQAANEKGIEKCADIKLKYLGESYPDDVHEILNLYFETKCWKKIYAFIEEIKSWGDDESYGTTCQYWTSLIKHAAYWDEFYANQSSEWRQKELAMINTPMPTTDPVGDSGDDDLPF